MKRENGFTLVELMITLTVLAVVVAAISVVMIGSQRSKAETEAYIQAQQSGRTIADIVARDVRSAGFMIDEDASPPQPAFAYVDSVELILYANLQPATPGSSSEPDPTQPPLAPDPAGTPLPARLAGPYVPPLKYATGAEMIRYTLDLNNDGLIDANDQAHVAASDARRTGNPNDYLLARVVYGDSSGTIPTAGDNGGDIERVGLVRGPAPDVPPLFQVYLGSLNTPWDWSNGAIPANRLNEISRVVVNVTTEARRPDEQGNYLRSTLTTEVNSLRNVPDAGITTYTSDGYVFDDQNFNGVLDGGEPGIPNVTVRMGTVAIDRTNSLGYYRMQVPPGSYVLRQEVPAGFGPLSPDTVLVDFIANPFNFSHNFADSALAGGWIIDSCYVDENENNTRDPGELPLSGAFLTVGSLSQLSNGAGYAEFFVSPGSWTMSATAPESLVVSTTNPVNVTMADGDTVYVEFGFQKSGTGTVSGSVYIDANRSGTKDPGETGIEAVWVAVTKDAGQNVLAFGYTDASGDYTLTVPNNLPAGTTPYQVTVQAPTGFFPTSPATIGPLWVSDGDALTEKNFGMNNFQVITLNAERVLSLSSAELMEKDWSGSDAHSQYLDKGHQDVDLILGSEFSANPNVSVWFNQWNSTPLFAADPTYQRNAFASALSVDAGVLDLDSPWNRPDLVTGLNSYPSGNLAVWLTQNTDGNFGFLPSSPTYYMTLDGGDVNAVELLDVDGDSDLDILAGTKTSTNYGSFEVWTNAAAVFTRAESFPPAGGVSGLGEVRDFAVADFDNDGTKDVVLATKQSGYSSLTVLEGSTSSPFFKWQNEVSISGEVTQIEAIDFGSNGVMDLAVALKLGDSSGQIEILKGDADFNFSFVGNLTPPGVPISMEAADMGGDPTTEDLIVGFRTNYTTYAGGLRIFFLDGGSIVSPSGTDPSGGSLKFMVPALESNNFNAGQNPAATGTPYPDFAAAIKASASAGAVLVFIR